MPMRVVSSELDPHRKDSDVSGKHTVLYPTSDVEVKEALIVAKVLGVREVLVRSGRHAADNTPVDGTATMVINLRNHSSIEIDGQNNVTVCAGATTASLAAKLEAHNLFLPLDGNPDKSVFSNVRSAERGFVPAFSLGRFLTSCQGINKENMGLVENILNKSWDTQEEHIVTKMVFKAKSADDVKDYRMTRLCFTYNRTLFSDVLRHVFFGENKVVVGNELDLRVTAFTGAWGMPLFSVTAICPHESQYVTEMLKRLDPGGGLIEGESKIADAIGSLRLSKAGREKVSVTTDVVEGVGIVKAVSLKQLDPGGGLIEGESKIADKIGSLRLSKAGREKVSLTTDVVGGVGIVKAVSQEGKGSQYRHEKHRTRYSGELTEDKLDAYVDAVHRAVALKPTPILPGVRMISTVSWKAQDGLGYVGVGMSLYAPLPKNQTSAEKQLHRDFAEAIHDRKGTARSPQVGLSRLSAVINLVDLDVGKQADITIPNFNGEVYTEGKDGYDDKKGQYATSSYEDEIERMTPYAIGYPMDSDDVVAFVEHAIQQGKKVVARSGGHQYCGMSSGGSDTMLLSMDLFDNINITELDGVTLAHAGPGARLADLANIFEINGVTIPQGECIGVCIGGHVQTGGFGHLLRSYGLALDHVNSFDIVLASPVVEMRTIERPVDMVQDDISSSNDRIFWGVMGGGAGSFGVVTNIVFECIRDIDHPYSCGYQGIYSYDKDIVKGAMTVVQERTKHVFEPDVLPGDCDLMVSVMSGNVRNPTRPTAVVVEMVHGNINGLPLSDDDIGLVRMKKEIADINASKEGEIADPIVVFDPSSSKHLSKISNAFVRHVGMTDDGREFEYPYVKRLNCTLTALSDEFVEEFVGLIDKAMTTKDVKLIFQMGMGGGAYQANGDKGISSFPYRDKVMNIVFDLFYSSPEGETAANELHNDFGALLPLFSGGEDIRLAWGSFGDIHMNNVHDMYYGSGNGLYERLQKLKEDVDPEDHFHTPFNVQLPALQADRKDAGGRAGKRVKRKR